MTCCVDGLLELERSNFKYYFAYKNRIIKKKMKTTVDNYKCEGFIKTRFFMYPLSKDQKIRFSSFHPAQYLSSKIKKIIHVVQPCLVWRNLEFCYLKQDCLKRKQCYLSSFFIT